MAKMMLLKVYKYVPVEPAGYQRELYDAIAFNIDGSMTGLSSPLGTDEEFEVYIEEIE